MKKIICIVLLLMLTGCEKISFPRPDTSKTIYETFSEMSSYTARIKVFTYSNSNENTYEITQYYSYPEKYRSECGDNITIINKEKASVSYGTKSEKEIFDNLSDEQNFMYLNSFFDKYYRDEKSTAKSSSKNDKLVTLSVDTGLENKYKNRAELILNTRDMVPVSLKLTDKNGKVYTKIEYISFSINPELNSNLFNVNHTKGRTHDE